MRSRLGEDLVDLPSGLREDLRGLLDVRLVAGPGHLHRRGPQLETGVPELDEAFRNPSEVPRSRAAGPLAALPSLPLAGEVAHVPVSAGPIRVVDASLLRTAHAQGREVHVWTVDAPEQMRQLLDLGVDGLLSDRPDLLRAVLRDRGQWPT
jgi:hypothetical protein